MTALQLTAEDYIALRVDTVNLKDRLRDIEADCRNRLHNLAPPNRGGLNSTHIHGAHAPVEEPSTASTAVMCEDDRNHRPKGAHRGMRTTWAAFPLSVFRQYFSLARDQRISFPQLHGVPMCMPD